MPDRTRGGERLIRGREACIRQHHDDHVERLGDLACRDDRIEAVLDRARGHATFGCIAWLRRSTSGIALFCLGRLPGAGPALNVDDDERYLTHDGEPDRFLLERVSGPRGDGHGALPGVGGTHANAQAAISSSA